jgi:hypothetical protein
MQNNKILYCFFVVVINYNEKRKSKDVEESPDLIIMIYHAHDSPEYAA